MPRFILMKHMFATAALLGATAVLAETTPLTIELSAEASHAAVNNVLQATAAAESNGTNPSEVSRQINRSVAQALQTAQSYPTVRAKNGSISTYPVYGKTGKIESWNMRSEIILESTDTAAFSELLGKLQSSLGVSRLIMTPSPENRRTAENEAILEAIGQFKDRAKLLANALGKTYSIQQLSVSTGGLIHPPILRQAMTMKAEAMPMPVEAGESLISVTVSGKIAIE